MSHLVRLRSYLYAPGNNEKIARAALSSRADAVILDLEDAVAPAAKPAARDLVANLLGELGERAGPDEPQRHVRVNLVAGSFDHDDLSAVVCPGLDAIRLPKAETVDQITRVDDAVSELEVRSGLTPGRIGLYPTIETAAGAVAAAGLACCPRVVRLAFGATDFLADIGARDSGDGLATLHVRSHMVLVSRAAGIGAPVDSVYTDLRDLDGLRRAARQARDLGCSGKSIIHPRQLDIVHEEFSPSDQELAWARQVIAAFEQGAARDQAALTVDGQFVDPAVVARARGLLV